MENDPVTGAEVNASGEPISEIAKLARTDSEAAMVKLGLLEADDVTPRGEEEDVPAPAEELSAEARILAEEAGIDPAQLNAREKQLLQKAGEAMAQAHEDLLSAEASAEPVQYFPDPKMDSAFKEYRKDESKVLNEINAEILRLSQIPADHPQYYLARQYQEHWRSVTQQFADKGDQLREETRAGERAMRREWGENYDEILPYAKERGISKAMLIAKPELRKAVLQLFEKTHPRPQQRLSPNNKYESVTAALAADDRYAAIRMVGLVDTPAEQARQTERESELSRYIDKMNEVYEKNKSKWAKITGLDKNEKVGRLRSK